MNIKDFKHLITDFRKLNNKNIIRNYFIFGILFGCTFPIIAYFLKSQPNILFYVICTAPIFLGLFSLIAGVQRALYENENKYLTQIKALLNDKKENENKFSNVVNMMAEGLIIQDSNGNVLQFNPSACEILNVSHTEIKEKSRVGYGWIPIKEDGTIYEAEEYPSKLALRTNDTIRNVILGIKNSKDLIKWVRVNAIPFETSTGRNVMTTFTDITSIINFQNENKKLFELNTAILKSSKFIIITTSLDGTITGFNEQAEIHLGYKASEVINFLKYIDLHDKEEIKIFSQEITQKYNKNISTGFESIIYKALHGITEEKKCTYFTKSGGKTNVRISITALYDNRETKLTGYLIIAKDINDEVLAQELLESEKVKSLHNSKLASLGEMAAGIAHEINNPLAVISGNIHLLKKFKNDEEKYNSKENAINKSIERISKIVSGMRKFSRTSSEDVKKSESLQSLISESLVIIEPKLKQNSVHLTNNLKIDSNIYCNSVEIEQVFVNLISNAIDAIQVQNDKWIRIEGFETPKEITIKIVDSGNGIPKEVEEKIFQPFFTTKGVGKGTGLGLSITKGILDNHDAKININRKSANTCFEVTFKKVNEKKQAA